MERARVELGLASGVLAITALVLVLVVGWAAGLHRVFLTGSSPREVFNAVPDVPVGTDPVVTWRADLPTPRAVEPATRVLVEDAWVAAFARLDVALRSGDGTDLVTSFSGAALEQVAGVVEATDPGARQVPLSHDLRIGFYSDDGSIIALRDLAQRVVRVSPSGATVAETVEAWDAVLLLRDGRWRVEQLVRSEVAPAATHTTSTPAVGAGWDGVNYLPRTSPWEGFWPATDPAVLAADLDRVRALELDTVRVFLPALALGWPEPDPARLDQVAGFLDLADERGVGVVVTLFDGWTARSPETWADADRHLDAVVGTLAGHPAIVAWDLKNEPDRDDAVEGRPLVRAWLRHVAVRVRELDPVTPRTIGWSSAEAVDLVDVVEVVSFHHYRPAVELADLLAGVTDAADGRPVVLGEFGLPTWDGLLPGGHTEAEQAAYLADVLTVARDGGVDGTLVWTLHDLDGAPPDAGRSPRRVGQERSLGLLRADGSAKPAAAVLDPSADLASVPRPGPIALRLGKRLWRVAGLAVVLAGLVTVLATRRRGRA